MIIDTVEIPVELPQTTQTEPLTLARHQQGLIVPIGDVHYGARGFPEEKFKFHLQWAVDRGAWFLGMGEYLDFTSQSQVKQINPLRDSTKEAIDELVRAQADRFIELASATRGRWLGLLEGDHRWTFQDATSVDQYICRGLGCPNFLGTSALLRIPLQHEDTQCSLFVYAHHGIGSSRTAGGHLSALESLLKWIEADVYLMGHTHAKTSAPIDRLYLSSDGVLYHRTKLLLRTGGWLRGYVGEPPRPLDRPASESRGSYVEQKAYMPSALGSPCIGFGVERIRGSIESRPVLHYSI